MDLSFVQSGCQTIDLKLCTASKGEKKCFQFFTPPMPPLLQLLSTNLRMWDTCSLSKILEFLSLTGKVEGKRDRGKQRITFLDSLCNSATGGQSKGLNFLKLSDDRDVWRGMVANVCSRSGTWWWWWWLELLDHLCSLSNIQNDLPFLWGRHLCTATH